MTQETTYLTLDSDWRVSLVAEGDDSPTTPLCDLPAQVPGHVHLDLVRAGVIPDPFYRMHERDVAWVDQRDWVYETTFHVHAPAPSHAYLRFNGLDTIAQIELNGKPLGQTQNMFVPHEFPVGDKLRKGENTLRVTLRSALREGARRQKAWDEAGNPTLTFDWFRWSQRSFVRKAQYMYGWDWGPELVSCGIWQPVELITAPVARILDWKHDVEFDGDKAIVRLAVDVERAPGQENSPLRFHARLNRVGSSVEKVIVQQMDMPNGSGKTTVEATLTVEEPVLWRPNRQTGGPSGAHLLLYDISLSIYTRGGMCIDSKQAKIGLRTIELVQEPDPDGKGQGFKFRVNDQDLFIKGANWIPNDSFPSRITKESLHERLSQAKEAGFNMLRVWGGGLYESEDFYEICDELGILVWQDFPYGCAYYPDTGEYAEEARHEAVAAVRRIRNHPSLALWCGNNENHTMFHDDWGGLHPPRFLGEHIYHEVLPAVVAEEDPKTPYIPSSPYGGENPNSPDFGDRHNWDVWHGVGDWKHYTEDRSRFCSEFGFASSCSLAAWDTCLAVGDKDPYSPAVRWHDKTRKGYDTYLGLVALHHNPPATLEDLVYTTQINQAEAMKYAVEHYRRLKGRCWGTLFWQLNDCWPVQSWAVIDHLGAPKAAYYACKRFYAPVLLSLVKASDNVEVHLVNDLLTPVAGKVTVSIESFDGKVLAKEELSAAVAANGAGLIGKVDLAPAVGHEREAYVYAAFTPGSKEPWADAFLILAEPKELRLADPGVSFTLRQEHSNLCIMSLRSERFAPYVWLQIEQAEGDERLDIDDNFFHLRAGAGKEVWLWRAGGVRPSDVAGRIRIRSL